GDDGKDGTSINIKGSFTSESELPATAEENDAYLINGEIHVWVGTGFINAGNIQGPSGDSAYDIALQEGFEGSKAEWLASLKGEQGQAGLDGKDGRDGTSVTIKGTFDSTDELPAAGESGDGYLIQGHLWVWVVDKFVDVG